MVSLGVEWYQFFSDGFSTYIKEKGISFEKDFSDKDWSNLMFEFLEEMAKNMNYHVNKEESTIKGSRIDMVWRSSDRPPRKICIEHENQDVTIAIKEEVCKLADYKADLHVCITYVNYDEYPGSKYSLEVKSLLEGIGYNNEFLLILGSEPFNSPTDWVCHRLFQEPHLNSEMLVLPSPVLMIPYLGKKENIEEEPEEWMINRLKVWKRIQQSGGSVTREQLHDIAKNVGMDNRGLGGFFTGKESSLYWKNDKVNLREWVKEYVKKYGDKVD